MYVINAVNFIKVFSENEQNSKPGAYNESHSYCYTKKGDQGSCTCHLLKDNGVTQYEIEAITCVAFKGQYR